MQDVPRHFILILLITFALAFVMPGCNAGGDDHAEVARETERVPSPALTDDSPTFEEDAYEEDAHEEVADAAEPAPPAIDEPDAANDYTDEMTDQHTYPRAIISTEFGDLTVELWNDVAPNHVENFLKLARDGFYDNLVFHRIIPDFVIQGGCPQGTGTGGPGWTIDAEFNERQHVPGTLSMARSQDPNSAGSQFFICLTRERCQHLDRQYTAFGQVIEGLDIVEKLGSVPIRGDRPVQPPALKGVRPID